MDKKSGIKIESNEQNNLHLRVEKDVLDLANKIYKNIKILDNVEKLIKESLSFVEKYESSMPQASFEDTHYTLKDYIEASREIIILQAREEALKKIIRNDLIDFGEAFYETIVRMFPKNFL